VNSSRAPSVECFRRKILQLHSGSPRSSPEHCRYIILKVEDCFPLRRLRVAATPHISNFTSKFLTIQISAADYELPGGGCSPLTPNYGCGCGFRIADSGCGFRVVPLLTPNSGFWLRLRILAADSGFWLRLPLFWILASDYDGSGFRIAPLLTPNSGFWLQIMTDLDSELPILDCGFQLRIPDCSPFDTKFRILVADYDGFGFRILDCGWDQKSIDAKSTIYIYSPI